MAKAKGNDIIYITNTNADTTTQKKKMKRKKADARTTVIASSACMYKCRCTADVLINAWPYKQIKL